MALGSHLVFLLSLRRLFASSVLFVELLECCFFLQKDQHLI